MEVRKKNTRYWSQGVNLRWQSKYCFVGPGAVQQASRQKLRAAYFPAAGFSTFCRDGAGRRAVRALYSQEEPEGTARHDTAAGSRRSPEAGPNPAKKAARSPRLQAPRAGTGQPVTRGSAHLPFSSRRGGSAATAPQSPRPRQRPPPTPRAAPAAPTHVRAPGPGKVPQRREFSRAGRAAAPRPSAAPGPRSPPAGTPLGAPGPVAPAGHLSPSSRLPASAPPRPGSLTSVLSGGRQAAWPRGRAGGGAGRRRAGAEGRLFTPGPGRRARERSGAGAAGPGAARCTGPGRNPRNDGILLAGGESGAAPLAGPGYEVSIIRVMRRWHHILAGRRERRGRRGGSGAADRPRPPGARHGPHGRSGAGQRPGGFARCRGRRRGKEGGRAGSEGQRPACCSASETVGKRRFCGEQSKAIWKADAAHAFRIKAFYRSACEKGAPQPTVCSGRAAESNFSRLCGNTLRTASLALQPPATNPLCRYYSSACSACLRLTTPEAW